MLIGYYAMDQCFMYNVVHVGLGRLLDMIRMAYRLMFVGHGLRKIIGHVPYRAYMLHEVLRPIARQRNIIRYFYIYIHLILLRYTVAYIPV
jgi:hypothetical protein